MASNTEQKSAEDQSSNLELLLMRLRYKSGRLHEVSSSKPLLLNDPTQTFFVYTGTANVFWVPIGDTSGKTTISGTRRFLFQVETGHILFGMDTTPFGYCLEVVGAPLAQLSSPPPDQFSELVATADFTEPIARQIEQWVALLCGALFQNLPPRHYTLLKPQGIFAPTQTKVVKNSSIRVTEGAVWVQPILDKAQSSDGKANVLPPFIFSEQTQLALIDTLTVLPLTSSTWIEARENLRLLTFTTLHILQNKVEVDLPTALDALHRLVLGKIQTDAQRRNVNQRDILRHRQEANSDRVSGALVQLAAPLIKASKTTADDEAQDDMLLNACRKVGEAMFITVKAPLSHLPGVPLTLPQIAAASRFRYRRVALRGDWWREDHGPLLAYTETNKQPRVLIPGSQQRYIMIDPATNSRIVVSEDIANSLHAFAHTFYRTFPARAIKAWGLLLFAGYGLRNSVTTMIALGIGTALLALLVPAASGVIVDQIIPNGQHGQLLVILFVLLASVLSSAAFEVIRAIGMLNIETRMDLATQTALIDRVMELPVGFFRKFASGDLVMRLMAISTIRQTLSEVAVSSILAGIFAVFSLLLLFAYSVQLAVTALVLGLILVAVVLFITRSRLQYERTLAKQEGDISAMLVGFLSGIAKFRVAGAEGRAFSQWAAAYGKLREATFRARTWGNALTVFNSTFPTITTMVVFASVVGLGQNQISTGGFVAFNTAFLQFISAALTFSAGYAAVNRLVPVYERAKPILETVPETDATKVDPGELKGEIDIQHVSFRYKEDGPLTLNDISIHIAPGEFVGMVGPSGSGKSSILRLLMGFEQPLTGKIYFDGKDWATLDARSVRRQVGVVLQNGRLLDGSLLTNIIGASGQGLKEAWEAARMAGIEEDIRDMPMGMHTLVAGGGATLSGGQRQRILIARALNTKPRLLFFDEATSALDNRTQAIVSDNIAQVDATKVVIAHRLNTIVKADQIYVFENGHVVQQGTYQSLMKERGLFANLARRQML